MTDFDFIIGSFDDTIVRINEWTAARQRIESIRLNAGQGNSPLVAQELERGFYVRARNYALKEQTKFHLASDESLSSRMFMISLLLNPESILIEINYEWPPKIKELKRQGNIIFASCRSGISLIVKAAIPIKGLDLCFSAAWLMQQLPAVKRVQMQELLADWEGDKHVSFGSLSISQHKAVNDIIDDLVDKETDLLYLKARVMPLMNEIIENLITVNGKSGTNIQGNLSVILAIEKKISLVLHERIPDLKTIAREYAMSESTLKRRFKKVYGMAVYEYHLFKKMEYANKLLRTQDLSVTQVAYTLGYEKVSSFIKMFKQQFGVSPGSLRSGRDTDKH